MKRDNDEMMIIQTNKGCSLTIEMIQNWNDEQGNDLTTKIMKDEEISQDLDRQ